MDKCNWFFQLCAILHCSYKIMNQDEWINENIVHCCFEKEMRRRQKTVCWPPFPFYFQQNFFFLSPPSLVPSISLVTSAICNYEFVSCIGISVKWLWWWRTAECYIFQSSPHLSQILNRYDSSFCSVQWPTKNTVSVLAVSVFVIFTSMSFELGIFCVCIWTPKLWWTEGCHLWALWQQSKKPKGFLENIQIIRSWEKIEQTEEKREERTEIIETRIRELNWNQDNSYGGGSNPRHCGSEPKHYQLSYSGPPMVSIILGTLISWSEESHCLPTLTERST